MVRLSLLITLVVVVVPAIVVSAYQRRNAFHISGKVYCDTCRCGFETNKTTYISGATVRIQCKDRTTMNLKYSIEGTTNEHGMYEIEVEDDHEDQICNAVLVNSPLSYCNKPDPRRNRTEVIVTRFNGAVSDYHHANAMGFLKDQALPGCTELIKELLYSDV